LRGREEVAVRLAGICLVVLGVALQSGLAEEPGHGLRLMSLRLQEPMGVSESGGMGPEILVGLVLGGKGGVVPHLVGLFGVRDPQQVEDMIWPLNRALGQDRRSYLTWLTGGGPQGKRLAVLSLFPLAGFEDFSLRSRALNILYAVLDVEGRPMHVILAGEGAVSESAASCRVWREILVARLIGRILGDDPGAWVVVMGDLVPELVSSNLRIGTRLECLSCPPGQDRGAGVIMAHPWAENSTRADMLVGGSGQGAWGRSVQWNLPGQ
jgi:hypothetical protein